MADRIEDITLERERQRGARKARLLERLKLLDRLFSTGSRNRLWR
jgi:hypothetical protein